MDSHDYFISWGTEYSVEIQRFEVLQKLRASFLNSYQEVLDRRQTFTQFFSLRSLRSCELEKELEKRMGCKPIFLGAPTSGTPVGWLDIVRHGRFQRQDDSCYQCTIQGRSIKLDRQLHSLVEFCRSLALDVSKSQPHQEDVQREFRTNLGILTDLENEIKDLEGYRERLEELIHSMKFRQSKIELYLGSGKSSPSSKGLLGEHSIPDEPNSSPSGKTHQGPILDSSNNSNKKGTPFCSDCEGPAPTILDSCAENTSEDELDIKAPDGDNAGSDVSSDDTPGAETSSDKNSREKEARDDSPKYCSGQNNIVSLKHGSNSSKLAGLIAPVNTAFSENRFSMSGPTEEEQTVPMNSSFSRTVVEKQKQPMSSQVSIGVGHNVALDQPVLSARASKRQKLDRPRLGSDSEKLIAVAWMKSNWNKGWTQKRFEMEYGKVFGRKRVYSSLKRWIEDQDGHLPPRRDETEALDVPASHFRETSWNVIPSWPTPCPPNAQITIPDCLANGSWNQSYNLVTAHGPPSVPRSVNQITSGLPNLLD
ncbi:hypothetical protein N7457_001374 [Penicillium paradoxum]|uniref:uncharacterized protein n=1 Tax=Penicillium paradoxum TaxID=176176 RepID=UPI002547A449|nr:uncharacterized protein N7457_001374 [Penicillium paradoxum]KAJ5794775.1 hypothetical protein N7457_001374 [Penicillium paradoxum]